MSRGISKRATLLAAVQRQLRKNSTQSTLMDQAAAERLGLNPTDRNCLEVLVELGFTTAGTLAELTSLTTGAITGVVDRLEKMGYVKREDDPVDRRRVIIRPLLEHMQNIADVYRTLQQATEEICADYRDDELEIILSFLTRSEAILHAETEKLRSQVAQGRAGQSGLSRQTGASIEGIAGAQLHLIRAANVINIVGEAIAGSLFKAHFDGKGPEIRVDAGNVTMNGRKRWSGGTGHLQLNTSIPWRVCIDSLPARINADLRKLSLSGAEFKLEACELNVSLPQPQGTTPIEIAGHASKITFTVPTGAAVRIQAQAQTAKIKAERRNFHANKDEGTWETPGYATATDRYTITTGGWANEIRARVRG